VRASQRLDDLADFGHAHPIHKHLCNGRVQFVTATMIALEHLGVIAPARPRDGQIRDLAHRRFQIARVVPITLIMTLLGALIGQSTDEGGDFLLSHTDERYAHRFPQPLLQHLLKCLLTSSHGFDIVLLVSHWYPPGYLNYELFASSGYQTLIFHTIQHTTRIVSASNAPVAIHRLTVVAFTRSRFAISSGDQVVLFNRRTNVLIFTH
jgi:hypothetical protein